MTLMSSRRDILKAGATALVGAATPGLALARMPGEQRFVFILLRGGMDGLAVVPPLGDPDYARQRGGLALKAGQGAAPLMGPFALHPAMPEALAMYQARQLAVIHAVAPPHRTRSHFDAQNVLEGGGVRAFQRKDGWLNRALAAAGAELGGGLAIASAMPLAMRGAKPVASWAPRQAPALADGFQERLARMYADDPILSAALDRGLTIKASAEGGMAGKMRPVRALSLAANARLAADFLRRQNGPRVAMLDGGQWDTHVGQGTLQGRMPRLLTDLDNAFAALKSGLDAHWRQTVVVAVTEFGRTVRPNGGNGTDHGFGSAAFVLGGAVRGGRVVADWPGLSDRALFEGRDLMATMDMRRVLKGLLQDHLKLASAKLDHDVFPDSGGVRPLDGLIRG